MARGSLIAVSLLKRRFFVLKGRRVNQRGQSPCDEGR